MSATPKKMAQPRNSQPSTLMPVPLPYRLRCEDARASVAGTDRVTLRRISARPDARMVQVEGGTVRPDPRDRGEVMPRRRARSRPLQRIGEAPRVILDHALPVFPG